MVSRSTKWNIENPLRAIYANAKAGAKQRNKLWELEYNYFLLLVHQTKVCPVFGIPLLYEYYTGTGYKKSNPTRASIDRKDSSKGYTKENTWIISWAANSMKGDLSMDDFKELLRRGQEFAWSTTMRTEPGAHLKTSFMSIGTGLPQISNLCPSSQMSASEEKSESYSMISECMTQTYSSKLTEALVVHDFQDTILQLDSSAMLSK